MRDGNRVLYVGDERDAEAVAAALEAAGGATVAVAGATAALDALADGGFDCVVAGDSGADPVALLERIRGRRPDVPVALFPADGSEALAGRALDAGADAYVPRGGDGNGSGDDPDPYATLAERVGRIVGSDRGSEGTAGRVPAPRSGTLFERLLETSPVGIVVLDAEGRIERANERAEEIFDLPRGEITDRTFDDPAWRIVGPDGDPVPRADLPFSRVLATGEAVIDYHHGIERSDGDRRWLSINAAPLGGGDGGIEYVVAAVTDVTEHCERERALEALHDTTRRFVRADSEPAVCELAVEAARTVLGLPINCVWLHDEGEGGEGVLRPVAWTDEAEALVDHPTYTGGESLSWEVFERGEFRLYEDLSGVEGQYNPDGPLESEIILPLGDHGVMNIGETAPDAFDETDVALARLLAANAEAALERIAQEAERRARARELERQNERLEEFASVISHDLRNPLGVARGRLELLSTECDSDHVDPLAESLARMDAIVEDVLTLARRGELVGATEPTDLRAAAGEAWTTVETDDAGLENEVGDAVRIEADRSRLRELLENLFRNAVEHAGRDVTVRVGPLPDREGFYVEDDGPGIPPGNRDRVFDLGYSTADGGTGFGLKIVERIARAHGWSIAVAEGADGGARFEVTTGNGE